VDHKEIGYKWEDLSASVLFLKAGSYKHKDKHLVSTKAGNLLGKSASLE
jgi:hypothetical protein